MMISGHRKSFQDHMNWMIASVASAGSDSGSTILNRMPSREVPSIRAASSSSIGSVRKNWRSMKMPNALHRLGMISPPTLSTMPEVLDDQEGRDQQHLEGHHQRRQQHHEQDVAAEEADPRERVGGEAAEQQLPATVASA